LRLFERAEGILLDEQPIIPLYHYVNAGLYRPNVKGLWMNPRNTVLLKGISMDPTPR
jgi:ABC-type oligopeptide transport system substrate-binding subunit